MIYIISDGGYVKIGYTNGDVYKRMSTLQTGTVAKLSILGHFPGERTDEQRLHAEFAHRRIAGEWFQLTIEEVGDLIRREAKPSIERTFSEDGMITIITDAMNKKLRSLGFSLLTTTKPGITTISVNSGVRVLSFCEQARDEIVTATTTSVTALELPEGCSALTKVYKDKGELTCSVILSHNVYDLKSVRTGKLMTYEQILDYESLIKEVFLNAKRLQNLGCFPRTENIDSYNISLISTKKLEKYQALIVEGEKLLEQKRLADTIRRAPSTDEVSF